MTIEPVDSVRVMERMKIAAKADENAPRSARLAPRSAASSRLTPSKKVSRGQRMMTMPTKPIAGRRPAIDADDLAKDDRRQRHHHERRGIADHHRLGQRQEAEREKAEGHAADADSAAGRVQPRLVASSARRTAAPARAACATTGISAKKRARKDDLAGRNAVGHELHADRHQREDEGGDDLERDAAAGACGRPRIARRCHVLRIRSERL